MDRLVSLGVPGITVSCATEIDRCSSPPECRTSRRKTAVAADDQFRTGTSGRRLQLVKIAVAAGPLFKPGADVHYSNTNYALIGLAIEQVTGNSLEHALKTRLLDPLKLTNTTVATDGRMPSPHARGYLVGNGEPVDVTEIYPYYWGAGNLVADADDVAVFYEALMRGKIASAASLKEMKTVIAQTPDRGQGLGLVSGRNRCGRFYGHDGWCPATSRTRS